MLSIGTGGELQAPFVRVTELLRQSSQTISQLNFYFGSSTLPLFQNRNSSPPSCLRRRREIYPVRSATAFPPPSSFFCHSTSPPPRPKVPSSFPQNIGKSQGDSSSPFSNLSFLMHGWAQRGGGKKGWRGSLSPPPFIPAGN